MNAIMPGATVTGMTADIIVGDPDAIGETTEAHRERTLRALREIAERHPAGRVVVVTHGGSVRRVQAAALGMALPVLENCGHWVVSCENGAFRAVD